MASPSRQERLLGLFDDLAKTQSRARKVQDSILEELAELDRDEPSSAGEITQLKPSLQRVRSHHEHMGNDFQNMLQMTGLAGKRVCEISELLEAILLLIPMRDVLLAQRVSKRFSSVIEGSTKLQSKLYMKLDPCSLPGKVHLNPMLSRMPFIGPIYLHVASGYPHLLLNKSMCAKAAEEPRCVDKDHLKIRIRRDRDSQCLIPVHGSWQRMYLTSPPCMLAVDYSYLSRGGVRGIFTLGELMGTLKAFKGYDGFFTLFEDCQ